MLSYVLPGLADIDVRKPQVPGSSPGVGSSAIPARTQHIPAVSGVSLVREVASWSAVNGTERDGLGHRETLGMAMAWKLEMRTEVTPGTSDRLEVRAASGQVQALPALPPIYRSLGNAGSASIGFPARLLAMTRARKLQAIRNRTSRV